jgi:DNA polymerase
LQYYGASRTGRWSGRLIQPHNLPKNDKAILSNIPLARGLVLDGDAHYLDICYDNLPVILSQLVRTAFVPTPGRRFIVSDLSAIEARIVAWLARETWRLDVFKTHGKIYEASASRMFNVPLEQITKDSPLRYKGKLSELSLGFQGSIGALIRMGALEMGLKESELQGIVNRWRAANPNIVNLWGGLNEAAVAAVENPGVSYTAQDGLIMWADRRPDLTIDTSVCPPVSFQVLTNVLFITLPSGRKLCYLRPRMRPGNYGMTLTYEGVESSSTGSKKWGRVETYGGKLLENIAQGIARDVLAEGMLAIDDAGYDIALHVHDEAVADVPHGTGSVQEINELMSRPVAWAPGLPLAAESFETDFYKKDA